MISILTKNIRLDLFFINDITNQKNLYYLTLDFSKSYWIWIHHSKSLDLLFSLKSRISYDWFLNEVSFHYIRLLMKLRRKHISSLLFKSILLLYIRYVLFWILNETTAVFSFLYDIKHFFQIFFHCFINIRIIFWITMIIIIIFE